MDYLTFTLKVLMFFVGIIISVFAYRLYYFSSDKKYLLFSCAFCIFSLTFIIELFEYFYPTLIFVFRIPLTTILIKIGFLVFIFLLILSLLSPRQFLEWGLALYIVIFTLILSFTHDLLFFISIALLLFLVAIFLFANYIKNPSLPGFLTFVGMLSLSLAVILQFFNMDISKTFEALAAFIFLFYVLIIFIKVNKKHNKKQKTHKKIKKK